jgi:hypothetical protein
VTEIPECKLSVPELGDQQARYRRVAPWVDELRRDGREVVVRLSPGADRDLVREVVAIERDCCPFYAISYDADRGIVRFGVDEPRHEPALEAIEYALRRE